MVKFATGIALLFLSSALFAQALNQTIKGQIIDEQSGAPIIGATVQIVGSDPPMGSITDVDGFYRIEKVPIGRQSLHISYLGYEPVTIPSVLVGAGKEVIVNAKLIESLQQLDEVVVTAENEQKGQPKNELATVSAISLGMDEISRYPATLPAISSGDSCEMAR